MENGIFVDTNILIHLLDGLKKIMKVLVDIRNEAKVPFVMEFLSSQSYIKTQPLSNAGAKFMQDLKDAMTEVKQYQQGKIKLKTAEQLLHEL